MVWQNAESCVTGCRWELVLTERCSEHFPTDAGLSCLNRRQAYVYLGPSLRPCSFQSLHSGPLAQDPPLSRSLSLLRLRCQGTHLLTHFYSCSCGEDLQWNRITIFQRQTHTKRRRFCSILLSNLMKTSLHTLRITNGLDGSCVLLDCQGELAFACVIPFRMLIPEISLVHICEKERPHTEVSDCFFTHVMTTVSPVNAARLTVEYKGDWSYPE